MSTRDLENRKFLKDENGDYTYTSNGNSQVVVSGTVNNTDSEGNTIVSFDSDGDDRIDFIQQRILLSSILKELKQLNKLMKLIVDEEINDTDFDELG